MPGMIMGTAGYMSPEQAQGKIRELDLRSDIFSFGCILFEAATGQRAFEGKDPLIHCIRSYTRRRRRLEMSTLPCLMTCKESFADV
jgi:serine/threonine protein kinase